MTSVSFAQWRNFIAMSKAEPPSQLSKVKKIEWYAAQLATDAVAKEKTGKTEEAIVDYLQAADVLLLLAKNQDNYTVWKDYADRAMACQQRVKLLMAKRRMESSQ